MKSISVNTKLYYLLTYADGEVHEKEKEMGERMLLHEIKDSSNFHAQIDFLKTQDDSIILEESIGELLHFTKNDQVNCLAWMCLIANADGFMDKNEWALIYNLYHKELGLDLKEITARQKELHQFIRQYRNIPEAAASTTFQPKNPITGKTTNHGPTKSLAFPM